MYKTQLLWVFFFFFQFWASPQLYILTLRKSVTGLMVKHPQWNPAFLIRLCYCLHLSGFSCCNHIGLLSAPKQFLFLGLWNVFFDSPASLPSLYLYPTSSEMSFLTHSRRGLHLVSQGLCCSFLTFTTPWHYMYLYHDLFSDSPTSRLGLISHVTVCPVLSMLVWISA